MVRNIKGLYPQIQAHSGIRRRGIRYGRGGKAINVSGNMGIQPHLVNKIPRGRAIEVLQGIVYFPGVLNHNLRVHRPRAAEALAEAQAEREGRIKNHQFLNHTFSGTT